MVRRIALLALIFGTLLATAAQAFVVQEENPLSYNNMAREGAIQKVVSHKANHIQKVAVPVDNNVDYQAIAAKLFPSRPDFLSLNMINSTVQRIRIKRDFLVRVMLPQQSGTSWRIETNENIIKPLSTQKINNVETIDGVRNFEFLSVRRGTTKIYLDNYNTESKKVIQSRIIRVSVY